MKLVKRMDEQAVSPVVGVMLMLAVTILIAAVVSAFAGGAISGNSKTPQATIQATYSQSNGMTISHRGGDPVPVSTTTISIRPTKSFGANADKYSWHINKSVVSTGDGITWDTSRSFLPGDTVTISRSNMRYIQTRSDGSTETGHKDVALDFMNEENIGLSFAIELQDSSGKAIGRSTVIITA